MVAKAKAKGDTTVQRQITIEALRTHNFEVFIMGDAPLIVNQWTLKAKQEMLQKHMKQLVLREAKDPYQVFLDSMYRLDDGSYGFPVVAIKETMATATVDRADIAKTEIYRNVFMKGQIGFQVAAFADIKSPYELAELYSPNPPRMREDMVRLAGQSRTPDIRYRAEFWPWAIKFTMGYMTDFISEESLYNLLNHGGFVCGLGEWRQEKGGNNGRFHVADEAEKKQIERWIKAGQKEPPFIDTRAWLAELKVQNEKRKREQEGDRGDTRILERYDDPVPAAAKKRGRPRKNGNGTAHP